MKLQKRIKMLGEKKIQLLRNQLFSVDDQDDDAELFKRIRVKNVLTNGMRSKSSSSSIGR